MGKSKSKKNRSAPSQDECSEENQSEAPMEPTEEPAEVINEEHLPEEPEMTEDNSEEQNNNQDETPIDEDQSPQEDSNKVHFEKKAKKRKEKSNKFKSNQQASSEVHNPEKFHKQPKHIKFQQDNSAPQEKTFSGFGKKPRHSFTRIAVDPNKRYQTPASRESWGPNVKGKKFKKEKGKKKRCPNAGFKIDGSVNSTRFGK